MSSILSYLSRVYCDNTEDETGMDSSLDKLVSFEANSIPMDLFFDKKILTVSQLTALVRDLIEENFEHVWVEGEISNLSLPSSGHIYFTLKDAGATLRCVMFRASAKAMKFRLADGMKVILRGRMTVYDQRGDYQLI